MLRNAAFASSVVASIPIVFPFHQTGRGQHCSTQVNTARCVSSSINRRVRDIVEWSGDGLIQSDAQKSRNANESSARQAIPRSESTFELADQ